MSELYLREMNKLVTLKTQFTGNGRGLTIAIYNFIIIFIKTYDPIRCRHMQYQISKCAGNSSAYRLMNGQLGIQK